MKLNKRSKIALSIATVLEVAFPLLIVLLYLLVFFLMPLLLAINPKGEGSIFVFFFIGMLLFSLIIIFFAIFQIVLKILYLAIIIQNKRSTDLVKILFVLGVFYVPYIAMPIYCLVYILKENSEGENLHAVDSTILPA